MLEKLKGTIQAAEEGTFKAVASAAGSVAYGERGPTRFAKGAFAETLKVSGGKYPLLWQHREDQPIGIVHVSETKEGLIADGQLAMDIQQGKEAHSLLKLGGIDGVSIGFNAKKAKHVIRRGETIREVEQADLAEISLVTFPADREARVTQVHSEGDVENELHDLSCVVTSLENVASHVEESQAGRVFSEANLKQIRSALGSLVGLVEKVDPGHIASIGRRAARILKKSFLHNSGVKKRAARHAHAVRMGRLRSEQIRLAYPAAAPEEEAPRARMFDDIVAEEKKEEEQWRLQRALMQSIGSIMTDPRISDKPEMVRDTVSQYLVAVGDAEMDDDEDEDDGAAQDETHVHDPRAEKRGEKWVVVDADGKVYGEHDTKDKANAQVRALRAESD